MRQLLYIVVFLAGYLNARAQELVINGGAEQQLTVGWTQLNPAEAWYPANAALGGRPPHSGTYHFFPGNNASAGGALITELYQDIDLTSNSVAIDAGTASYTFSGWRMGYPGGDLDQSQIIIEYRNSSGGILTTFTFPFADFTAWTHDTKTQNAPIGTRSFRIRLISKRVSSGADNDGYYDDISFVYNAPACIPPTSVQITPNTTTSYCLGSSISITSVIAPFNPNYYYTWYQNGNPITTQSKTYTPIMKAVTGIGDGGTYTLRVEDGNTGTAACYKEASVTIVLDPPVVAGTISSNSETCNNTIPAPFTGTASTDGTAAKYYKWQRSINPSSNPWVDVQAFNTTATDYAPTTPVLLLAYYRRIDSSGACPNVATNTITIRTRTKYPLNAITSLVRDTLCIGENFQLVSNIGPPLYSINGGFYFTWKQVQGTTTTTVMPTSNTLNTYPAIAIPAMPAYSGTYYLIVQDGLTATSQCKDSVKIVIRINQAPTQKALIQSNQELCLGAPATQLTELSPAAGSTGAPLYYQWYTTADTTGTPTLSKPAASAGVSYDPGTQATTKYYVRTDSIKYCSAVKTNFLKIRVNNKPILDSIRPTVNDTLCENYNDPFQLKGYIDSITAGKQSINGGFYFTWKRHQEQTFPSTKIVRATGKYTDYPAISRPVVKEDSGTYYLIVQDGINAKECLDSISFKITVGNCNAVTCSKPEFISIKVAASGNTTLCAGRTLTLQKDVLTLPSTPPTFAYTYSWVRTNTLGTVVVQPASTTYQDLVINSVSVLDSGRYQLIVKDGTTTPAVCSESSQPISIVIQDPITQALIGYDTTVCTGNPTAPLIEIGTNTGGTGTYTHQWEFSTDEGVTFTTISGATNSSYQAPSVSTKTFFRRLDQSGVCPTSTTDTIIVNVTAGVDPGIISTGDTTVCTNAIFTKKIRNLIAPSSGSGGVSSITYQWQKSTDNSTWITIPGTNTIDYTISNSLTATTYYRRQVGMGYGDCDTAHTTPLAIYVYPNLTVGSIGSDQSICSNTDAAITDIISATGNNIHYKWVQSFDRGITWSTISGVTGNKYTTPLLTDTTWYKRIAVSTCGQDSSNSVKVDVITTPIVSAGADTTVQRNSIITLQGNVIGSTYYSWTPSTALSNPNILNPDATITGTITYTLRAEDASGTCNAQSSVTISVTSPLIIPNIITPNGDGANDTWSIEHIEDFPNATFMIYNRWGNIVWKASGNALQWNGTNYRNGELLADGTYFYIIDLKSITYSEPLTGYVQLIK